MGQRFSDKDWGKRVEDGDSFSITVSSTNPSVPGGALSSHHTHDIDAEVTSHEEVRAQGLNCRRGSCDTGTHHGHIRIRELPTINCDCVIVTDAGIHGKRVGERKRHVGMNCCHKRGFPGGTSGKEPTANTGDTRDMSPIPGSGRAPGGGHGNPLQGSCLENAHG